MRLLVYVNACCVLLSICVRMFVCLCVCGNVFDVPSACTSVCLIVLLCVCDAVCVGFCVYVCLLARVLCV